MEGELIELFSGDIVEGPEPATISFDCPNRLQAIRLAMAFTYWGAEVEVEPEGRKVDIKCSTALLMASLQLANDGVLERIQTGKITARRVKEEYLSAEPGESRG